LHSPLGEGSTTFSASSPYEVRTFVSGVASQVDQVPNKLQIAFAIRVIVREDMIPVFY
jgi:hypothetical protein